MDSPTPVRISKIAGRFLVFDHQAVALLRRQENINGTLVGTTPQQPTQNIFLGLPIELRPEEVDVLVRKNAAYIVDDVAAHRAALQLNDAHARQRYIDSLRKKKQAAAKVLADSSAKKAAEVAQRLGRAKPSPAEVDMPEPAAEGSAVASSALQPVYKSGLALTPTSSCELVQGQPSITAPAGNPLCGFLQGSGCFMTPGLRFGARYSVYPGDPLRYHAHHMANPYGWHEEIPVLDLVGGGRLATAVKKSFLLGGQPSAEDSSEDNPMRIFTIEWASM